VTKAGGNDDGSDLDVVGNVEADLFNFIIWSIFRIDNIRV